MAKRALVDPVVPDLAPPMGKVWEHLERGGSLQLTFIAYMTNSSASSGRYSDARLTLRGIEPMVALLEQLGAQSEMDRQAAEDRTFVLLFTDPGTELCPEHQWRDGRGLPEDPVSSRPRTAEILGPLPRLETLPEDQRWLELRRQVTEGLMGYRDREQAGPQRLT